MLSSHCDFAATVFMDLEMETRFTLLLADCKPKTRQGAWIEIEESFLRLADEVI